MTELTNVLRREHEAAEEYHICYKILMILRKER